MLSPHQLRVLVNSNVNAQLESQYKRQMKMPKLMIRMIFYTFSVCSWYFSYMKQALYCHTLVSIPDSLTADAINTHMFSDVSETTDILQYGKCDVFTYLSFFCKTILSDDQQSSRSMDWLMSI